MRFIPCEPLHYVSLRWARAKNPSAQHQRNTRRQGQTTLITRLEADHQTWTLSVRLQSATS